MVENIRTGDKNNWNLSSNEFVSLASSLSNFFAQSGIMQKANLHQNNIVQSDQQINLQNQNLQNNTTSKNSFDIRGN